MKDLSKKILSDLTIYTKYARYIPELQRRETWEELVSRNMNMHIKKFPHLEDEIRKNYRLVFQKKVLPSMRSLQFGGRPIEVNPARIFNCSYLPIDDVHAFGEVLFLLLSGCGVGFSIQFHHIEKLPPIKKPKKEIRRYLINDSIEGWADAVKMLMKSYFNGGYTLHFDYSDIREKGAALVTSGGKAPGPKPLKDCLERVTTILERKNDGEKLSSVEVHDIICHIADAVLVGGIRRAALISLFDKNDKKMREVKSSSIKVDNLKYEYALKPSGDGSMVEDSDRLLLSFSADGVQYNDIEIRRDKKTGEFWDLNQYNSTGTLGWWVFAPQRGRANNSVVLDRNEISYEEFMEIWKAVEDSNAGEPGIYWTNDKDWGTNPCVEIALRPFQFCNLTEINGGDIGSGFDDYLEELDLAHRKSNNGQSLIENLSDEEYLALKKDFYQKDLEERARVATFIGTLQASYTDFHYLRRIWKKTTEKDALIGVGITGIGSGIVTSELCDLTKASSVVLEENERVAKLIGINKAARTTCVKPSGTTSLVVGSSSGIHAWHAPFYIRRMRFNKNEPIYHYFKQNLPSLVEDDLEKPEVGAVVSIPQKAPKTAILRSESPMEFLERVKKVTLEWVKPGHRDGANTHNVSATISIKKEYDENFNVVLNEWNAVGQWMWENRDLYAGLSCLPYFGGTYKQAPFEDIDENTYNKMMQDLNVIDLTKVVEEDSNVNFVSESLACAGGNCEIL